MKSGKTLLFLSLALVVSCGGGGGGNTGNTTPPTLVSITLTPLNPSVITGASRQFTATGTYSDNSVQNLTASVTWSSTTAAVATISNDTGTQGLVSAVAAGTTTITATSGLVTGSTIMTVTVPVFNNVLPLSVNGSLCSASSSYPNKPCVSVTVCAPGTSTCQTISDILLDTGSYGLRIFKQALTVLPPPAAGTLAECVQFGDGSSVWGAVQMASVILANEPAVQVPIQVIDASFGATTLPAACSNAYQNPAAAGFAGILGVGLFTYDCGQACANSPNNGKYFTCNGTNCSGTTVPLAAQIKNPVALLPQDNNGVIVQLPGVPAGGAPSVSGSLILVIGTQANNTPSSLVTAYSANQSAQFSTRLDGQNYASFLDTGSNGLFFTPPVPISTCSGSTGSISWFCPALPLDFTAENTAASGAPTGVVTFRIDNLTNLTSNTANHVFAEIGGTYPVNFDWGLPFFFGKSVYVGFDGKTSATLGTGPYWAY